MRKLRLREGKSFTEVTQLVIWKLRFEPRCICGPNPLKQPEWGPGGEGVRKWLQGQVEQDHFPLTSSLPKHLGWKRERNAIQALENLGETPNTSVSQALRRLWETRNLRL